MSFGSRILRRVRIAIRNLKQRHHTRQDVAIALSQSNPCDKNCPVCGSEAKRLKFEFSADFFEKYLCPCCFHLFGTWSQTMVQEADELFNYTCENENLAAQSQLMVEAARWGNAGPILDFGAGGNLRAAEAAKNVAGTFDFWSCDLYASNRQNYFVTYDETQCGRFSGISSYAVMEHLTAPLEAWRYMNRLLKPCNLGGGVMVHAFPTLYHHRLSDWQVVIRSHTCIFSRRSLPIILKKTGFALVKADPVRPVGPHLHPVFLFRKIRDVK